VPSAHRGCFNYAIDAGQGGAIAADIYEIVSHLNRLHGGGRRLPNKWLPISIAPSGADLELCVIDKGEVHALVFPCQKNGANWVDASTKKPVDIQPTHWRIWNDDH
jgi:hypothetical protein